MARIRSVKPELFLSTTIAELSVEARYQFIGMWTFADNFGNAPYQARLVRAAVWPLDDDISVSDVEGYLEEIKGQRLIEVYKGDDGKEYFHVTGWEEHQVISHPGKPKYPTNGKATGRRLN